MIDFSAVKSVVIPEGKVKQISKDGVVLWKGGYKNLVPLSVGTDGQIYNGGLGYKTGYRVRSGGAEAAVSGSMCTGYIPYKKGDILRIKPDFGGDNTLNAVNFSDASFTNLGQRTETALYGICASGTGWGNIRSTENNCTVIDISGVSNGDDIAYVRITHIYLQTENPDVPSYVTDPKELIVTVNEEIT